MVAGSCHCGAVRLEVSTAPAEVTDCNCSICRRISARWAYYSPRDVTVTGTTVPYIWGDRMLALHHCQVCGCTTHWTDIREPPDDRMGINARLLDIALEDIPVRKNDGASY
jgi:hypothetical protein